MRDCINNVLSEYDYMDEKIYSRVLGCIDDISIVFRDENLENFLGEVNNHRVGLLQLICLEELYKDTFNSEVGLDITKFFRNEKWIERKFECVNYFVQPFNHGMYL